ncbi:craniofacial development protein 1-like [Branchiostoma floridae]|uniref:Craniofacial development protein 1 n=1 Tax=Branchiostoma floridae TaxID=7739 RepID=A0A9J7MVJ6_BRAFL|nr:craniofacial development protein 1-like [Branchiostoma floridae]XP_035680481.1 craniofacial development protein 1-like [Branchiostoma floridae]
MSDSEDQFSSDSEDEDYVPSGGEISEDSEPEGEEEDGDFRPKGKKAQKKSKSSLPVRQSKRGVHFENKEEEDDEEDKPGNEEEEEEEQEEREEESEQTKVTEEVEKKKADDLWASFLKDVGGPPARPKTSSAGGLGSLSQKTSSVAASSSQTQTKPKPKVTVTKVYDFAGEEVKVSEEVDADSVDAQSAPISSTAVPATGNSSTSNAPVPQQSISTAVPRPGGSTVTGVKRPAAGGLGSVLSKIGKKPKISTLVKSKIDWDSYKKEEQIEEDLAIHNRGKEGYLERQAFLQRTDLRQFEVERNMRMANRNVPR